MKILDFNKSFPDEEHCKAHWKEQRESQGVVCRHCGGTENIWKEKQNAWVCSECYTRTSLRSGTVMHKSKLPFRDWYIAMHLLTCTKHSFSAKDLQRELERKRYEPGWAMFHKLRHAMGARDSLYELSEFVEFDDSHFSTFQNQTNQEKKESAKPKNEVLKRGRGSQKKSTVIVMAESLPASKDEQESGNFSKTRKLGHIKMVVVPDLKKKTMNTEVKTKIDETSTVRTDGSTSFADFKTIVKKHEYEVLNTNEDVNRFLPWVHTVISNAKRYLLGIHFLIGKGYLQQYLNEICYIANRRYLGDKIFDRLIVAAIQCKNLNITFLRGRTLQTYG